MDNPNIMSEQNSNFLSGALQGLFTTAQGYLDKRLDITLAERMAKLPNPQLQGTQYPIMNYVPNQAGLGTVGLNLNGLMPLLLVGAVVFMLARSK